MEKKTPFSDLTPDERRILRESFIEAFGEKGSKKRDDCAKGMASSIGTLLQQEYKLHQDQWWLWTLGKPARPLTAEEVVEHKLDLKSEKN